MEVAEVINPTGEAMRLRQAYLSSGVVTEKSAEDALHVAVASVAQFDLIVNWNFIHIVHFDKIPKYNAVNTLRATSKITSHF